MDLLESTTFTSLVTDLMRQNKIPGLSIAVIYNGEIASKGYGIANYETNTPCTGDTLFDIASSAKSLTAASVALLVDDKNYPEVQYDALISDLLPEDFVMSEKSYTNGITVDDILSHRTGMANHNDAFMGPNAAHPDNARSVTRNLRNLKPAAPLRSRYLYCNQMYTVATHLVEVKSKKSFSEFLDKRIFTPLYMNSTTLQPASARAKGWKDRMAKGYIWQNDAWRGFDPQECPEGQGAGSVISSANDFIKWIKALLCREGPINDRVYQGLTKLRSIVNPNARRLKAHTTPAIYAAGMEMYYYRGNMVIGHDGTIPGFRSRFVFMPDLKFGVVVLGNSAGAGGAATTIIRALMDEILGIRIERRPSQNAKQKKKNDQKKDLVLHSKPHHDDKKEVQARLKDEQQTHTLQSDQYGNKGKDSQNKETQRPQGQKKQGKKPTNQEQPPPPPQETPLEAYVGRFWNAGYRAMIVTIKDNQLFIDATDRSNGFTMTFEHVKDQTVYIAHTRDVIELGDEPVDARFVLEDGKAIKMGLDLEPAIKEMIWFERDDSDLYRMT
ncbi:Penicillin-binding protein 4 [Talaromyces pinophilus]|nr:Penicillin-binding protein 4 [Talaromyces pinophilus]